MLGIFCCMGGMALAQEEAAEGGPFAEISASGLLYQASKSLGVGDYASAVPYLEHYLERMEPITDDRVVGLKQAVRLKLGKVYAYMEDPFTASNYLVEYTETLPCYRPREAYRLMALTYFETHRYEECIGAVQNALSNPLPKGLPREEKKTDYDDLSKDQLAGFSARQMKRIEEEAKEAGEDISAAISDDVPDAEPDYTIEEQVFLHMTLGESHTELEQWEESLDPYKFVIENALLEERKGYAIMQLVNALLALDRFDDAQDFIVKLFQTNARYDIRVNMALLSSASVLFEEGKYDSALMLYRMILPREEMVDYQISKMNVMRREAGLPRVQIQTSTNDMGQVQTLFGNQTDSIAVDSGTFGGGLPPKPDELVKLEDSVGALLRLPAYEDDVLYRTGLLFSRAGRPWEAVAALDHIVEIDPDNDRGQDAFVEALMVFLDPLEKYEEVYDRGSRFLSAYLTGRGPRRVAHTMTSAYQVEERWKDIKKLLPIIDGFAPSEDEVILKYECELYYMQAIADIVLLNYASALAGFRRVLDEFPESHQQENSTYWHAMAELFLKNYQDALDQFDYFTATWPEGSWVPSAVFHSGVSYFGMEKYDEARERFTRVIETWPEHSVYSDACSMRADLLASKGLLDEAQHDYEEAIAKAQQPRQATYAVFQLTSMFDLEERYDEILEVVNSYLETYELEADVAKAAYWIGKTKLAQGLTDEAIEAYRVTIIEYGGDVAQDGVDLIISELLTLFRRLNNEQRESLQASLTDALEATDNVTLQLRLQVMIADMTGTSNELGRKLNAELDDLLQAPPPVLGVLCDASFENRQYDRAAEILDLFTIRYPESEFMKSALKLRAYELFDAEQYDEAMKIAEEAQAIYGMDIAVVWAQLMIGRIHIAQANYDAARELFRNTLAIPQWRGDAFAEATYYLGVAEETSGNPRDAFAWYQRAYFQFKGLAGGYWAAEGYLASARCLQKLNMETERLNTYRAMLFDKYINVLPQADEARKELGPQIVKEIEMIMEQGIHTNITVRVAGEVSE